MPRARGRGRGRGRGAKAAAKSDASAPEGSEEVQDSSQPEAAESLEEASEASQEILEAKVDTGADQEVKVQADGDADGQPSAQMEQSIEAVAGAQEVVQSEQQTSQPTPEASSVQEAVEQVQAPQQASQGLVADEPVPQQMQDTPQQAASELATTPPESSQQEAPTTIPKQTASEVPQAADSQELDDCSKLKNEGISDAVAAEIDSLIKAGTITFSDLTAEAFTCLKDFPSDQISNAIKEFCETDLSEIKNKGDHLVSILKAWQEDKAAHAGVNSGPNEAKIKELLERTGFNHEVTSGQRHYGPPANWEGEAPTHESEVFVGKVPRDVYEDELVPLCEECGNLYEIRIMIDPNTGFNRGFAFVRFAEKESASNALEKLNDYEIRPGKKIKVNVSNPNMRLFVGNIPKTKSKEEIMEEFSKLTENLKDVIVYSAPDDVDTQRKNRGFCFLQYSSHSDAAEAKKKLGRRDTRVLDSDIYVDWADPIDDNDDSVMAEVKILYVRNLSSDVTEDLVNEKFGAYGALEKVKRLKDYAFVHFEEREHALKAMEELNGSSGIGKCAVEVTLARPMSEKARQKREQRKMEHQAQRWGGAVPRGRGRGWGNAPFGNWGPQYGGWGPQYGGWGPQYGGWGSNYGGWGGDFGYGRQMPNYGGWGGYGGQWGQRPAVGSFRGRAQGYWPRGGRGAGFGQGPRGYGGQYQRGVGAFSRGGAGSGFAGGRGAGMKRKADDASNGANDAKKNKGPEAQAGAEQPRQDQDWTSDDVGATW